MDQSTLRIVAALMAVILGAVLFVRRRSRKTE
jgi:MYXO-CTERM domain-containing protein